MLIADEVAVSPPMPPPAARAEPIRVYGKFFFAGAKKHFIKGVTYGPFRCGSHAAPFPEREAVDADFAEMAKAGVNTVRVFNAPPRWLLDAAERAGLHLLIGLP